MRHQYIALIALACVGQAQTTRPKPGRMVQPGVTRRVDTGEGERTLSPTSVGKPLDEGAPGSVRVGSPAAASRQAYLMGEAAKAFSAANRKPQDETITTMMLSPAIDPETGLVKEDAENYQARLLHKPEPNAPNGRRARMAEIAGLTPAEAAKLYPLPDNTQPYEIRDIHTTDPNQPATTQEDVVRRLTPGQGPDRESLIANAVLTDAEATFAVYAALGFPFPIRVGRLDLAGTTRDGIVLFSPDLLRADPVFNKWEELMVSYRFMNNDEEVLRDTVRVQPFVIVPRPNVPVTHLWISCDKDVMSYAMRGVSRMPGTIDEARDQIQQEVVPVNSWLRIPTKIYGIRWGLLPTVDELTQNTATRDKMAKVLKDTGLYQQTLGSDGRDNSPVVQEFRSMADKLRGSGIMKPRPKQ